MSTVAFILGILTGALGVLFLTGCVIVFAVCRHDPDGAGVDFSGQGRRETDTGE